MFIRNLTRLFARLKSAHGTNRDAGTSELVLAAFA
jgi:hypothetical protein